MLELNKIHECADYEAIILHEAGYRKQSDTIKEFANKAINSIEKMDNTESWNEARLGFEAGRDGSIREIEALKKEYGVE